MHEYDVALSFAGEDRDYIEQVAQCLKFYGVKVFYDKFEEVSLWGKDNFEHLDEIYRRQARYVVMFISHHYVDKAWPRHERKSSQARQLIEKQEYILPARFDRSEVPGLLPTLGYIDLTKYKPYQFAKKIAEKLEGNARTLPDEIRFQDLELSVSYGHPRTVRINDEVWRNEHILDFTHRLSKDRLEIDIRLAELSSARNMIRLGFIFLDIEYEFKFPETRLIESTLRFSDKFDWLRPDPKRPSPLCWIINGDAWRDTFPHLMGFDWLSGDFIVEALPHQGPRPNTNDPQRSHTVEFRIFEK